MLATGPEQASAFKLAGNFLIGSMLESLCEAFVLLRKHGIDPRPFHELMAKGLFRSPVYENYGDLALTGRFDPPGFKLALGLKDITLVQQAAQALRDAHARPRGRPRQPALGHGPRPRRPRHDGRESGNQRECRPKRCKALLAQTRDLTRARWLGSPEKDLSHRLSFGVTPARCPIAPRDRASALDCWLVQRARLIPLATADQHVVAGVREGGGEAEEAMERGVAVVPSVEAEGELVEVGLEVLSGAGRDRCPRPSARGC